MFLCADEVAYFDWHVVVPDGFLLTHKDEDIVIYRKIKNTLDNQKIYIQQRFSLSELIAAPLFPGKLSIDRKRELAKGYVIWTISFDDIKGEYNVVTVYEDIKSHNAVMLLDPGDHALKDEVKIYRETSQ
ncbi:MAG: hypothetical protein P8179_22865 [Candidatus Thiodiazotropha sp.]